MRICENPPTDISVAWFFADPGAAFAPMPNAFVSSIWDRSELEGPFAIGESEKQPRLYSRGRNLWGYPGECHVGSDLDWVEGLTAAELGAPPPLPKCCKPDRAPSLRVGGLVVAGIAGFGPVIPLVFARCVGFYMPRSVSVRFSNGVNQAIPYNGLAFTATRPNPQIYWGYVFVRVSPLWRVDFRMACAPTGPPNWTFLATTIGGTGPNLANSAQPVVTQYPGKMTLWGMIANGDPTSTVDLVVEWS